MQMFFLMRLNNSNMRSLILITLVFTTIAGCAVLGGKKWSEVNGRILEETEDEPIADAIIVALWKGQQTHNNGNREIDESVCYHVETAVSDNKGGFAISPWREPGKYGPLKNKTIHLVAFKSGYRTSELTATIYTGKRYVYYLADINYTDSEEARKKRLKHLQLLIGKTSCDLKGNSKTNLRPLYEAIVADAKSIAITNEDDAVVKRLQTWESFVKDNNE